MTAEENKAIVRRLIEDLWNAGNPELADQLYAAEYVRHGPHAEPPIRGNEALKHFASMYLAAVPDLHHEIEDQFVREDWVVSRATARGTHRGEMMGIAPTGKPITFSMFLQHRIAGGKIVEEWVMYDLHGSCNRSGREDSAAPTPSYRPHTARRATTNQTMPSSHKRPFLKQPAVSADAR